MKHIIRSKTKGLAGIVLGVEFIDGKAETEAPAALAFFEASDAFDVVDPSKATKTPTGNGTP